MGRRELRAELQATWSTYTPRVPGRPFRKKDLEDADERASLDEPSHPGAPILPAARTTAQQSDGTIERWDRAMSTLTDVPTFYTVERTEDGDRITGFRVKR